MGKNRNKNSNNRIGSDAHSFKSENGKMNGKKKHGNKYHLNGKVADTIVEKMSVYKRPTVYPPQLQHYGGPRDRFCTPEDKEFKEVLSECYKNFYIEEESKFSSKFHSDFQKALEGLEDVYQFDLTQPGGLDTKVAKTYVSRCLVGDCGTTYKYLGLRMFSIPWTEGEVGASEHSIKIGLMNKQLSIRSDALITADCNPPTPAVRASKGSCDFNLTLINRCFPVDSDKTPALKMEPCFGTDKACVSWHADSSLEHFSTIAVYHHEIKNAETPIPWRAAVRVWWDAEGPNSGKTQSRSAEMKNTYVAPPLSVVLPSPCAYFMTDDFNHHHQHLVLPGNTHRYASTHRVCRVDGHTFQSIKARCVAALKGTPTPCSVKDIRSEQLTLNEVEFEWIRQYYVQGKKHHEIHVWWHERMLELIQYWLQLQGRTVKLIEALYDAAEGYKEIDRQLANPAGLSNHDRKALTKRRHKITSVEVGSYDSLVELLQERNAKREGWKRRELEILGLGVTSDCAPLPVPLEDVELIDALSSNSNLQNVLKFKTCGQLCEHLLKWKQSLLSKAK